MKIGIDLNDVVRDYSRNFIKYFKKGINSSFDENNVDFWNTSRSDKDVPISKRDKKP